MRILIACEFSGITREAFRMRGHDCWSCDLLPSEIPGNHIQGDVLDYINRPWDMMIAYPPCTYLAVAGARWFKFRQQEQRDALEFVDTLWNAPIDRICLENPKSILSTHLGKPTQTIQPYMFGHPERKLTCLWLKNLPKLVATNMVPGRQPRIHYMGPSVNRGIERSRTYSGIAEAMACQWNKS